MKYFWIAVFLMVLSGCKVASKKSVMIDDCKELIFDLTDGTMNGVKPNLSPGEIKEWLPCYTKFIPDGSSSDCGGAIHYANHHFYFYTYINDYVEVRPGFKGKVTHDLMNKSREEVRQLLGSPSQHELTQQDSLVDLFATEFGCIRVHYVDNKATVIGAHHSLMEELSWCKE